MILLLTDKNDSHANYVLERIIKKNLPHYRFNLDVESLLNTEVIYKNSIWYIAQDKKELVLENIKCVWNRRTFVELLLDEEYDQSVDFKIWKSEWNKTLLGIYSFISNVPWLNFWRTAYAAENKFFQMQKANECGFLIPATIVSNSKEYLLEFARENNPVALKLMQQDFYKVDSEYMGFYVNKLEPLELERMGGKAENPIVLQKYIEKDFEVRCTVVGKNHFACSINSQDSKISNVDWRRYDIPNTPHYSINIPLGIKRKISIFMEALQIEYGALDFIVTKEREWYFLEVNSMGQFLWIEELTGLPISEAIIEWMYYHLN